MKKFEALQNYLKKVDEKNYLITMLYWEMDTICPPKALDYLVEIKTKLETEVFELSTSRDYIQLLNDIYFDESGEYDSLTEGQKKFILTEIEHYKKQSRVSSEFFENYMNTIASSKIAWKEAKEKKDFSIFKEHLIEVANQTKEYFKIMNPDSDNLYDEMLNEYTRGMKMQDIDPLFEELKREIIPIIKNLQPKELDQGEKTDEVSLINAGKFLLNYIGFDNDRGALGIYPHGYTTGLCKDDVRIAFDKDAPVYDFAATIIHEGGHGIFDQSYGEDLRECPTYNVCTMGLHESQSRFMENILGRNKNFWIPIYDEFKAMTGITDDLDMFMDRLNNARPSLIRTMADELTYCLHIIIRYEIERDLFSDKIKAEDLPAIWNAKYKEYLGVDVPNDAEGVMQDVHWSEGSFGYFPSYLLGSILDGMLLDTIEDEFGDVDTVLREGRVKEITQFLQENIHQYGETYDFKEVAERVCDSKLTVEPLVRYFTKKYSR